MSFFDILKSGILIITTVLLLILTLPVIQPYLFLNYLYLLAISAILLIFITNIQIFLTGKIKLPNKTVGWSSLIFIFSTGLSIFFFSPNIIQALLNPNFGLLALTSLFIFSLYFTGLRQQSKNIIITVSLIISLISVIIYFKYNYTSFPPIKYSLLAAQEIFRGPLNTVFGVGVNNYPSVFLKIKDTAFNQSQLWESDTFYQSNSAFLHILTETGLFGFFSLILILIISALQWLKINKITLIFVIFITVEFILLPPSIPSFLLLFLLLTYNTQENENPGRQENLLIIDKKQNPLFYLIPFLMVLILAGSAYFIGRVYLADYYFAKSLHSGNIKEVYDNQKLAIIINPFIDNYRKTFSQTNLLIADSISSRATEPSKEDKQTLTKAIQAAVEEAKSAVRLNENDAANWENLAVIYRNILNLAQNADAWSISSYQRAIILDPQNPKYRLSLGGVYFLLKRYDDAIRLFEETTELKPDWPNAYYNLAWAYYEKGDRIKAISNMEKTISLLTGQNETVEIKTARKDLDKFKLKKK